MIIGESWVCIVKMHWKVISVLFQQKLIFGFFRDDRQAYLNLQSDCKDLSSKITKLDGQCSVEMVKRFGEGVSMQDIESFAVNRTLEEMKELSKRKEQSLYDTINDSKVPEYSYISISCLFTLFFRKLYPRVHLWPTTVGIKVLLGFDDTPYRC